MDRPTNCQRGSTRRRGGSIEGEAMERREAINESNWSNFGVASQKFLYRESGIIEPLTVCGRQKESRVWEQKAWEESWSSVHDKNWRR